MRIGMAAADLGARIRRDGAPIDRSARPHRRWGWLAWADSRQAVAG